MANSIPWTCCQCGNSFEYDEGDTEERMCFECLDDNKTSEMKFEQIANNVHREINPDKRTSMEQAADAEDPNLDIKKWKDIVINYYSLEQMIEYMRELIYVHKDKDADKATHPLEIGFLDFLITLQTEWNDKQKELAAIEDRIDVYIENRIKERRIEGRDRRIKE
jgi:hypothetical protein